MLANKYINPVCIGIVVIGLILATCALVLQLIRLPAAPSLDGMALLVREFVLSPALVLLVFSLLWMERLAPLFRATRQEQVSAPGMRQPVRFSHRFGQWLSFMLAWIATSTALVVLTPLSVTFSLLLCAFFFGGAMWLLEARLRPNIAEG